MRSSEGDDLLLRDEVFQIVGAAIEVHRELGPGFLEAVYHEALEIELHMRGIPFRSQILLPIEYKGRRLTKDYVADFVCFDQVVVEVKALERLSGKEEAQILNYLKATGLPVGLLVNFGSHPRLEWKRFALTFAPLRDLRG
jgi:GxxExxY protein